MPPSTVAASVRRWQYIKKLRRKGPGIASDIFKTYLSWTHRLVDRLIDPSMVSVPNGVAVQTQHHLLYIHRHSFRPVWNRAWRKLADQYPRHRGSAVGAGVKNRKWSSTTSELYLVDWGSRQFILWNVYTSILTIFKSSSHDDSEATVRSTALPRW